MKSKLIVIIAFIIASIMAVTMVSLVGRLKKL